MNDDRNRMECDGDPITVCDACLQSSCWQGIFMCDRSRSAGIVQKSRRQLVKLALEHASYWKTELSCNHEYSGNVY